jgi:hypothetical protein
MVGCFLVWVGGSIHDSVVPLDIFKLHHAYDWANFRPITR